MRAATEIILRRLAGGDQGRDFDILPEEVEPLVAAAYAELSMQRYWQGLKEGYRGVPGTMIGEYRNLVPQYDDLLGEHYLDLPASPMSVSNYGVGIHHVGPQDDLNKRHYEIPNTGFGFINSGPNNLMAGKTVWYCQGEKQIRWPDLKNPECELLVRMSVSVDEAGTTSIPEDMLMSVIERVTSYYLNRLPEDQTNDGNDDPRIRNTQ